MSKRPERAIGCSSGAGFTLLEMLVTLVIVAMAMTLVSQLLGQMQRVEQRLAETSLRSSTELVRREWVATALEGLSPGAPGRDESPRGDDRSLQGLTLAAPDSAGTSVSAMRISLRNELSADATVLELRLAPTTTGLDAAPAAELLRWSGNEGEIRYLDADGQWHRRWPSASVSSASLPRAVVVLAGPQAAPLVVAAPQTSEQPLARRVDAQELP
jgi:prepilin-type N-terminal cleavage/methylation domain-containing protein